MAAKKKQKPKKNPWYSHIESGEVFELVKANPITLVPLGVTKRRFLTDTRRPTRITLAREYKLVKEL